MAPIDEYRQPADMPTCIPVFPLRGAILLPRARLPLNVFEPRYLDMLDFVLSNERIIGIIQPADTPPDSPESPTDDHAPLKSIGCAGRVTAYQELDDGRLLISLAGICRFETQDETTAKTPFRTFNVSYQRFAHDFRVGAGEAAVDRDTLLRVLKNYLEAHQLDTDWSAIANAPTELLINSLSIISPFGPEEKQALLEANDLKARAAALAALAEMDIASDDRSGGQVQ